MGIEIDLVILKEGEDVNKHLLCGICFMVLEEPIQCVSLFDQITYFHSRHAARRASAENASTSGKSENINALTDARVCSKLKMLIVLSGNPCYSPLLTSLIGTWWMS